MVDRWFEFMGNHPFLFGMLAVLIVLFFVVEKRRSGRKVPPSELGMLVNNQNAQIIDIRPKNKFAAGHIQGSRNVPFTELRDRLPELQAIESPVVVVCEVGMQSGMAVQLLGKANAMRLEGGITGWQNANMPLVNTKAAGKTVNSKAKTKTVKPTNSTQKTK